MDKNKAENYDKMNALCDAARKAGLSYGTFIATTTEKERDEIIRKYAAAQKKEEQAAGVILE